MMGASHTGKTNSAITIGGNTGQENISDKMQQGAVVFVSNANFQNNVFQTIKNSVAPASSGAINAGINILGSFFGSGSSYVQVGGSNTSFKNTFIDNDYGVADYGRTALLATYNTFSLQTTGVYVTANDNNSTASVQYNNFYQNKIGVNFYNNTFITAGIKANNFDNTASAVGDYTDNFAIRCTEATLASSSTYPDFDIDNNNISGYYNGIYASKTLSLVAVDNEVHMRADNGGDHWQAGIYITGTNNNDINNNIVDMSSLNPYSYWQLGIRATLNTVPKVHCNSVNNLYTGLAFDGANTTTADDGVIGNYMQNAQNGIWLVGNGVIGNQAGNTGSNSSDNAWAGTCTYYTYSQASSNPAPHIFYTRSGSGYDLPTAKAGNDLSSLPMTGNNTSAAGSYTCNVNTSTPSNTRMAGKELAGLMQNGEAIAAAYNAEAAFAQNINGANDLADNAVNSNAIDRYSLLSNIVLQQIDVQDNAELNGFMSRVKNENTGLLFGVDSLIHHAETDSTQITAAQNANAAIAPLNNVEQSQQAFNTLYLSYLSQHKKLSSAELSSLEALATQCPQFYGTSVLQARTVLFDLVQKQYLSVCEKTIPEGGEHQRKINSSTAETAEIILYPNPAYSEVFIDAKGYEKLDVKLYNIMGEQVVEQILRNNQSLNISKLANGMYTYKVYSHERELKVGKLIITH